MVCIGSDGSGIKPWVQPRVHHVALAQLAQCHGALGAKDKEGATWREALRFSTDAFGAESARRIPLLHNLARWHREHGGHAEALELYESSLHVHAIRFGPENESVTHVR